MLIKKENFFTALMAVQFMFVGCSTYNKRNASKRIFEITGTEIPNDNKMLFNHIDNGFMHGRHAQYTVFKFEIEPEIWLNENDFSKGKDEQFENTFEEYFHLAEYKMEKIPKEYIPAFSERYYWLQTQNVYFIYQPENLLLMVFVAAS